MRTGVRCIVPECANNPLEVGSLGGTSMTVTGLT